MKKARILFSTLGAAFLLFATGAQADLMLDATDVYEPADPANCDYSGPAALNSNTALLYCLEQAGITGETYKDEDGEESFALAGSYTVTYSDCNDEGQQCHSFTIEYDGGYIATDAYLVVKDGSNDPFWYVFDLSGWDGKETIVVNCLWGNYVDFEGCSPGQGSISHVSLFGGTVPEPGTMALLGLGLIGLGLSRRRKYA